MSMRHTSHVPQPVVWTPQSEPQQIYYHPQYTAAEPHHYYHPSPTGAEYYHHPSVTGAEYYRPMATGSSFPWPLSDGNLDMIRTKLNHIAEQLKGSDAVRNGVMLAASRQFGCTNNTEADNALSAQGVMYWAGQLIGVTMALSSMSAELANRYQLITGTHPNPKI